MKVNGAIAPYYTSMVGAGVSLRLRAVQVIQYVEGTSGAGRFGFDEEVGYVQTEEAKDASVSEDSKSESDF
jgi:hypothetical protein